MRYTFIGRNRKWNGWKSIEMVPMVPPTGWLQNNLKYFKDGVCFQTKWQMGQMQVRKQLVESTTELLKWHIKHTDRTSCSPCVLSNVNSNPPQYNTVQHKVCLCIGSFGVDTNWLCCVEAGYAQLLLNEALKHCCWLHNPPSGSFSGTLILWIMLGSKHYVFSNPFNIQTDFKWFYASCITHEYNTQARYVDSDQW